MSEPRKPLRSDMAWTTADSITVRGLDLPGEIMGRLNLGDFAFLEIKGRIPTPQESVVFNAMLATLVEHGMTPMSIAARMVYLGAPESLQAAVAAGLCGIGSTFAGTAEAAARMLQEALSDPDTENDLPQLARGIVAAHIASRRNIPGLGHTTHKPVDPRSIRLFAIAAENGLAGRYVELMQLIAAEAERAMGKPGDLPVNVTGALGALASEMDIPWKLCRGLAVIGRAIGIVGHLAEEQRAPMARDIWKQVEEESSSHRRRSP